MDSALNVVVTYAAAGSKEDRKFILKAILDAFPDEELQSTVQTEVKRIRRRKLRPRKPFSREVVTDNFSTAHDEVVEGHLPVTGPLPSAANSVHWTTLRTGVISFDCEFVDKPRDDLIKLAVPYKYKDKDGETTVRFRGQGIKKMKYQQVLASIAIVDYDANILYNAIVKHAPMTFKSDIQSRRVNGIKFDSLNLHTNLDLELVQKQAVEFANGNFIVTKTGSADFKAIGIETKDYLGQWKDLNHYYKREDGNAFGLKFIHDKIYGPTNFQSTAHTAIEDALATIKIFKHMQTNYVDGDVCFDEDLNPTN